MTKLEAHDKQKQGAIRRRTDIIQSLNRSLADNPIRLIALAFSVEQRGSCHGHRAGELEELVVMAKMRAGCQNTRHHEQQEGPHVIRDRAYRVNEVLEHHFTTFPAI